MNDREREQWIDNDEGLHRWFCRSHLSKRRFIRENREELDRIIATMRDGHKPAHYLVYGG